MVEYLNTTRAARYLGIEPSQLNGLRRSRTGPAYREIDGEAVFETRDLDEWATRTDPSTPKDAISEDSLADPKGYAGGL